MARPLTRWLLLGGVALGGGSAAPPPPGFSQTSGLSSPGAPQNILEPTGFGAATLARWVQHQGQ